jgi:serine/threonine-protein kinase
LAVEIRLERTNWALDPQTRLGAPGGFGEVFDGLSGTGEAVAIKRLRLEASEAAHREFRVASELIDRELRHVMPVLDYGLDSESDRYFLVMPRAQGSLADHLGASGILPEPEVVSILSEICVGLGEVPELVHRDLKPANILRHEDRWKIADPSRLLVRAVRSS